MFVQKQTLYTLVFILLILALSLSACQANRTSGTPTPAAFDEPTAMPSATPTDLPTLTPAPPRALLISAISMEDELARQIKDLLTELSQQDGLQLQVQTSLNKEDLTPEVRLVVVLGDASGLPELARGAPGTQFLAVNSPTLETTINLSQVTTAIQPDQEGFLAGYLAAVVTPDWRVGMLVPPGSPDGQKAQAGFKNGAIYFCGLCRPSRPPFLDYPYFIESAPSDNPDDMENTANLIAQQAVQTVYVFRGAGSQALYERLAQAGINIIGNTPPPIAAQEHWLASLEPDLLPAIRQAWARLIAGQGNQSLVAELHITHVNETLFSVGRQRLVSEILENLQNGSIDPGIEPAP